MPAPLPPAVPDPDPAGSFLFSDDVMQEITDQEKRGRFTAERYERLRPASFKACIKLLSDRWPIIDIARTLNVAQETVVAAADANADKILDLEKHFSKKLRRVAWYQLDRVERNPSLIPGQTIPAAVKFFFETAQLADGRPTEIIEERQEVDVYVAWKREVEAIGLRGGKKAPVIDGELVNDRAPAVQPGELPAPWASDSQSEENGHSTQVNGADCCNFCDVSAAESPAAEDPRGGGAPVEGGALPPTDNGSQKF